MKLLLDTQVLYSFWFVFGFLVEEACEHTRGTFVTG